MGEFPLDTGSTEGIKTRRGVEDVTGVKGKGAKRVDKKRVQGTQ